MIATELLEGGKLMRTYSTSGMWLKQETGAVYTEAVDINPTTHTYTEVKPEVNLSEGDAVQLVEQITKVNNKYTELMLNQAEMKEKLNEALEQNLILMEALATMSEDNI